MNQQQLWNIDLAENYQGKNYFWILPADHEELCFCASALDFNIKVSNIDKTLNICMW